MATIKRLKSELICSGIYRMLGISKIQFFRELFFWLSSILKEDMRELLPIRLASCFSKIHQMPILHEAYDTKNFRNRNSL